MAEDRSRALPAERRETVLSALIAAFGHVQVDAVTPITGGASGAFPFRVEIGGRSYLVRVEGAASPLRNPHQYDSMRIAAQAGIAPKIYHIDESARVAIMDFIEERSLSAFPGGPPALAHAIGEMLRRVQTTPLFPGFVQYPEIVSRLWAWVCRTGLFAPGMLDTYTERLASIRQAYSRHPVNPVSSHNDFVRRNVLFDGERLWLIDWESAYHNDPLVDVAIALDSFAASRELESVLLNAWLGHAPDDALHGRLALVRPLTRLYYAGVLLSASFAASGALADRELSAPTPSEFRRAIRDGRLVPGTPQTKHALGKMYLASFMTGAAPPGLDAAV
jgi:hypothetical protein